MAPIGKIIGTVNNFRVRRALAAATLAGVEVEVDPNFSTQEDWKTPEFLAKFPFGYLPAFEGKDGLVLQECGAIADYFISLNPNSGLLPQEAEAQGEVRQWQYFADQEITIPLSIVFKQLTNKIPYQKSIVDAIVNGVVARLEVLNKILLTKTFLVGERITVADLFVASALGFAFSSLVDAQQRKKLGNVVRYTETVFGHPALKSIFATVEFCEKQKAFVPPAKAEKPKKEKAPVADKPKEEKKKAKKEKEAEDDDIDLAPVEAPKEKNPLDLLPKSTFNLEDFKRAYSNLDTRGPGGSIEWFDKNFDKEGFSVWRIDYKYNDELTLIFMSNNLIGGLFARFEASRKYLFGSVGVLGKNNDSAISGVLILRGQDAIPVVSVAPDYESYNFTRLDLDKKDDRDFFEAALAWDLTIDGKEWADGKNYK